MKFFKYFLPVFFLLFIAESRLVAQETDTVSTEGLVFSEQTDTPVAQVTDTLKQADTATRVSSKNGPNQVNAQSKPQESLLSIFLKGFLGGFAALIMPCIFPMLPLTVSFFTKSSEKKSGAIGKAIIYGLSIIIIYVVLGLIITILFGSDALNDLATNGVFNMLFFILLLVFAISFLGAFEITLPSSWVNKMDEKSDTRGFTGLFFMAATLALVSFSCTGPIIGTLLVDAATTGALLGPAIGMFGFSFALAIPFTLFAIFPSWLKSLPKSGGWLNSVKVVLGFLELALALKFLSSVDLAYHWDLLDREVYLVLWIVIFALMGLYLLGKLKFSHDSDLKYLSIPRLFLSIGVFSFTLYMVPGLWGAPLKAISALLPPQHTQDFDLYTNSLSAPSSNTSGIHKYSDKFHAPLNLDAFFDYDEGLAYARKVNKPILIDFTGHACVNCRKMETTVWPDKEVLQRIRDKYVLIQLYVDDKTDLPEAEQYISKFSGKTVKTIGNKWSDFQASRYNANSQPFYVLLDTNEKVMLPPSGANYDIPSFLKYLDDGLVAFRN